MTTNKGNSVGWFEIYVDNMERAKKFYQQVFQTELQSLSNPGTVAQGIEMWAFPGDMSRYGANGALVKMEGFSAGRNSIIVYFSCQNCAVEEARVKQAGGKIQQTKVSLGEYGFMSLAIDTEGNMIGLHSMT